VNISDHISESLETIFLVKNTQFFDADPDPGSRIFFTLDPGWKKFGSGILDKYLDGSATLFVPHINKKD
jgi:hypothetical protein